MHVVTIVGARPQFVKAAALLQVMVRTPGIKATLLHTGQHYDANMSDVFFDELQIPAPDYHLGIGSGPHGQQTGRMVEAIERVLLDLRPDWILVLGDTNSTLAAGLAAAKLHVPVAHVEAGLRSRNRRMPEEINRVLVDHLSDLLLTPTQAAGDNLIGEGIPQHRIHNVGDVMYDVALRYASLAETRSRILERLGLKPKQYLLATVHRAENTDDPRRLSAILTGLGRSAADVPVVFPVHPRTRAVLAQAGPSITTPGGLRLVDPVGYLDMVALERNSRLIVTDSGGVQKEAFFHGVPCATLREETEWVELIESGWNVLVPPHSAEAVADGIHRALMLRGLAVKPYGDGRAAERVVETLQQADNRALRAA